jgi:hypothetical protein
MGFPTVSKGASTEQIATVLDRVNKGKFNATFDISLSQSSTSTTIYDPRITPTSALILDPLTSEAAHELSGGKVYIASGNRFNGSAIVTHQNYGTNHHNYRVLVIG